MPDYAACKNHDCLRRATCCRYLMVASEWQSYVVMAGDGADCEVYWPMESGAPFRMRNPHKISCDYHDGRECNCGAVPGKLP